MPDSVIDSILPAAFNAAIAYVVSGGNWAVTAKTFYVSLGAGSASRMLAKKPERPVFSAMNRTVSVRQAITPRQVILGQARVGGALTFAEQSGDNSTLHMVITLAGHVCEEIGDIYFNDELVPLDGSGNATGRLAGYARVQKSLGAEAGQPFADLVAESAGKWTGAHRQTGCAKIYVRLTANPDLYPTGIPNVTAVVKGAKLYDPRTGLTVWSNNAALCAAHYLTSTAYGLGADYATELGADALTAAANICDEAVALAAGGTEPRYRANGAFQLSERPRDVIAHLLAQMAGQAVCAGDRWHLFAGAYDTPTVTLAESDLSGPVSVQSLLSRRDNCNGVKGVFVDPASSWQPSDFPPVASDTYLTEDGGQRVWKDIDLTAFCTGGSQAQRLAKIELLRTRQGLSASLTCKLTAWKSMPGRTVAVTNARLGWSAKPFEVTASNFVFAEDGTLGVRLDLRETAAAVYDWSTSEEQTVDIAPNTSLPTPWVVGAPGTPVIAEELYQTTGSAGVKARAVVTCAAAPDAFVSHYHLDFRLSGAAAWMEFPLQTDRYWEVPDLAPGTYQARVQAVNTSGVRSAYSATTNKEIVGLTAPPADVTGFSVAKVGGVAQAAWTLHGDLDVRIGGRIIVRHSPLTSGALWNESVVLEEFNGDAVNGLLPLITGTYLAKSRDSSGSYSVNSTGFVCTEGMVTGFTTIGTSTQASAFSGTKTNLTVSGALLQLTDTAASLTGSYAFASYLDLSTVATRRFEADIAALSFDVTSLIDSMTAPVDDWGPIDGGVINDCDVTLYAATTGDDPAGSPTWGAWTPFFVADFTCRAAKFKLDFVSGQATHNIAVSTLTVHAKIPA